MEGIFASQGGGISINHINMSNQAIVAVEDAVHGELGNFNIIIPSALGITIVFKNMQKNGNKMTFDSIELVTIASERIILQHNEVSFN